jgi:hypothetical protein
MKKNILFILFALVGVTLMSCEPQRDDFEMGGLISPSDVKISITDDPSSAGDNKVILGIETYGITGGWFYNGKATGLVGGGHTYYFRSVGTHEMVLKVASDGGLVDVPISYTVTDVNEAELPPLEFTCWEGNMDMNAAAWSGVSIPVAPFVSAGVEDGNILRFHFKDNNAGVFQVFYGGWEAQIGEFHPEGAKGYYDHVLQAGQAEHLLNTTQAWAVGTAMVIQGQGLVITQIQVVK